MIKKIQESVFEYLSDLLSKYGLNTEFRYSKDLDVLNEFRRSIRLRVENKDAYEDIITELKPQGERSSNLGLFSRSPIRKSDVIGNNMDLEVFSRKYHDATSVELRGALLGEVVFTVKMVFDSSEKMELAELIYLYELARKNKTVIVNYDFGNEIEALEDVQYTLNFSEIEFLGGVSSSNLSEIDFTITVGGLFFMPFYKNVPLLDRIVISIFVTDDLKNLSPSRLDGPDKIEEQVYVMNRDNPTPP